VRVSAGSERITGGRHWFGRPTVSASGERILISNLQMIAMQTAVFPGDPRTSRAKLSSVTALLPTAPYGRRMTRRLSPAGRETTE
jgi:hypothetical protein